MMIKTAYISSTYKDLKEHREAVYKALHKIRYDVVCMEDYVATDERNVDKCCAHASGCDIYIGIFARRYGYIPAGNNPSGLSITEMEYRAARASPQTKVRAFLLEDDAPWPHEDLENQASQERLKALRAEIAQISYGPFRTPPELVEQVLASVYTTEAEARVGVGLDKICSLNQIPVKDSGLAMIILGIQEAIQETIRKSGSAVQVNLGSGASWWSTRLYLVAALLEDYTTIQQIVFLRSAPVDPPSTYYETRYLGMCSPAEVRRALASHFRDVDRAYRESVPDRVFDAAIEVPSIVRQWFTLKSSPCYLVSFQIGCAITSNICLISPGRSASGVGRISHSPSWSEPSKMNLQRSKRRRIKWSSKSATGSSHGSNSLSTTPSSTACAAPCPRCGVVACAASPINSTRPRYQGAGMNRALSGR